MARTTSLQLDPEPVGPWRMVWRGFLRRCPRCGSGGVFDSYFNLRDRCLSCGYRFEREEGSFTGTYLINFGVSESFLFVVFIAYVIHRGVTGSNALLVPTIIGAIFFAVIAPILFYPFAKGIWAAIALAMWPLSPAEQADAVTWVAAAEEEARHRPDEPPA